MNDALPPELLPTITSVQNRQVSKVRRWLARPRDARRDGVLVADGVHLVHEAFLAGLPCHALFVQENSRSPEVIALRRDAEARRIQPYTASPHVFRALSPAEAPQGIVGVFERPKWDRAVVWQALERDGGGHVAIAHGLQDPVNLGSILRSAKAAGIRALITSGETTDPFHHRAVRAAMGASFSFPILIEEPFGPLLGTLSNLGLHSVGLGPRAPLNLRELPATQRYAFVFGGEGPGIPATLLERCELHAKIPMADGIESLGVAAAAAVVFFHFALRGR